MWSGYTNNSHLSLSAFHPGQLWTRSGFSSCFTVACSNGTRDLTLQHWVNVSVPTPLRLLTGRWITVTGFLQAIMTDFSKILFNAFTLPSNFMSSSLDFFQGRRFLPATGSDAELLEFADVDSHAAIPLNPQRHVIYFPVHASMLTTGNLFSVCVHYHPNFYLNYCEKICQVLKVLIRSLIKSGQTFIA